MSKTGRASPAPPPSSGRRLPTGRVRGRRPVLRWILRLLLALPALAVLAVLGLALRLAAGPLEVSAVLHALGPFAIGGEPHGPSAARLEVGRAFIAWDAASGRPALSIRLRDVRVRHRDGTILDRLDEARASVMLPGLLGGTISVERLEVSGLRLRLRRDAGQGFGLGLAPPGPAARSGSGPDVRWNALRQVHVVGLQVSVQDLVAGQEWELRDVALDGWPSRGGVVGRFRAALLIAGRRVVLHGAGAAATPPAGECCTINWRVAADPLVPAELATLLPALAPLAVLDLPVTPALDVGFATGPGRLMRPVRIALTAALGSGTLRSGSSRFAVGSGTLRARALLPASGGEPVTLQLDQADLLLRAADNAAASIPAAPVLHAHGTLFLDRAAGARHVRAVLAADIARIGFATLAQYWPAGVAAGARRWITANITAGEARGLHVETRLEGEAGWSSLAETARSGGFDAEGLTIWWLRPVAPLRDMQARLTFQGPDALLIEAPRAVLSVERPGGPVGALALSNGSMRITGLDASEQPATIRMRLTGDLRDLLAELAQPRLRLLSVHPVPFTAPSGRTVTDLEVGLPLNGDVPIEAVRISAHSEMTSVHLGSVVAGRSLDQARLSVSASADGLSLEGDGLAGGIPARLSYRMDFRAGPPMQVTEQAQLRGTVDAALLRREGLDPSGNVEGSARLDVAYAARRDGGAQVSLGLELGDLDIATPVWSKRRGQPAAASAVVGLQDGRLVSIERIEATGPGLAVEARAAIVQGRARQVVVGRFTVGRTAGAGRIDLPDGAGPKHMPAPIRISAHGPVLDLSAAIDGSTAGRARPAGRRGAATAPAWTADLSFDTVFLGRRAALARVAAHVEDDGRRLAAVRLDAAGPTPVAVRLVPGAGGRRLGGSIADTGRLLAAFGVTDMLSGGALRLDARFDDAAAASPLAGTVEIGRFVVLDAPLAARIVRDLSIYGWFAALPAPQLAVDRLVAPFRLQDQVLTLRDARAHGPALGVTLRGRADLARQTVDLKGTVVPAWGINRLPGRLPLVGRLFSPEKDGGVLAATLTIRGPVSAPDLHVDPLAALAPGILRRLLFP